jgi:hypothetical protein
VQRLAISVSLPRLLSRAYPIGGPDTRQPGQDREQQLVEERRKVRQTKSEQPNHQRLFVICKASRVVINLKAAQALGLTTLPPFSSRQPGLHIVPTSFHFPRVFLLSGDTRRLLRIGCVGGLDGWVA